MKPKTWNHDQHPAYPATNVQLLQLTHRAWKLIKGARSALRANNWGPRAKGIIF